MADSSNGRATSNSQPPSETSSNIYSAGPVKKDKESVDDLLGW